MIALPIAAIPQSRAHTCLYDAEGEIVRAALEAAADGAVANRHPLKQEE